MMTGFRRVLSVFAILVCLAAISFAAPVVSLYDWAFHYNGTGANSSDPTPAGVNTGAFDFTTGLGTITMTYTAGGAGMRTFLVWLDHDIDAGLNSSFNEFAALNGALPAGAIYDLDDPSQSPGIYDRAMAGALNNANLVGVAGLPPNVCCDVSMALGWKLNLGAGDKLTITFSVSQNNPGGFSLSQTDPESQATVYFSSSYRIIPGNGGPVVPEPGALVLAASGLALLLGSRWLKGKRS